MTRKRIFCCWKTQKEGGCGEILLEIFIGNNKQILYSRPDTGVISLAEFNQTEIDIDSHMFQILYGDQGGESRFRKKQKEKKKD